RLMTKLIRDIWQQFGFRIIVLLVLMVLTALMEGFGLAALLPLLMQLSIGTLAHDNIIVQQMQKVLALLNLPMETWSIGLLAGGIFLVQYLLLLIQSWLQAKIQATYMINLR